MALSQIRKAALRESNPQATLNRIKCYVSNRFLDTQTIPGKTFHSVAIHQMKQGVIERKPQIPSCTLGDRALSPARNSFYQNKLIILRVAEPARHGDPKPCVTVLKQAHHLTP